MEEDAAIDKDYIPKNFLESYSITNINKAFSIAEQEQLANKLVKEIIRTTNKKVNSYHNKKEISAELPDHLELFRLQYEKLQTKKITTVQLPVITSLSPRTKRKLMMLPPPNQFEQEDIAKYELIAKEKGANSIYKHIKEHRNSQSNSHSNSYDNVYSDNDYNSVQSSSQNDNKHDHNHSNNQNSSHKGKGNMVLLPKDLSVQVVQPSTEIYEVAERTKKRKNKQAEQLKHMFEENPMRKKKLNDTNLGKSVGSNLGNSVGNSVGNSIGDSVGNSRGNSRGKSSSNINSYYNNYNLLTSDHHKKTSLPKLNHSANSSSAKHTLINSVVNSTSLKNFSQSLPTALAIPVISDSDSAKLTTASQSCGINSSSNENLVDVNSHSNSNSNSNGRNVNVNSNSSNSSSALNERVSPTTNSSKQQEILIATPTKILSTKLTASTSKGAVDPVTLTINSNSNNSNFITNLNNLPVQEINNKLLIQKTIDNKVQKEYLNNFSANIYDELGLDINKEYNRVRKYKNSIQILMLYWYNCKVRNGFLWWKQQIAKAVYIRRMKAGKTINKFIIINLTKKEEILKLKLLEEQRINELKRIREHKDLCNQKASIITNAIRLYSKMKRIKFLLFLRRKVTTIQRILRGCMGRNRANLIRAIFNGENQAALVIQTFYRQKMAEKKVSIKKKLRFIQGWLEHIKDMRQKHVDYHVNNGAVLYISKAYMMFKMRKRLTKLLYWNHYAKSIIIQRYYRGYIIRKKVTPRLLNYKHSLLTENQNATIIQKIVRGYYGRKRFTYLVYKKEQEQDLKYQEKLLRLATSKGVTSPQMIIRNFLWKFRPFKYIVYNKKAVSIQRVWRGSHARRRCFILRIQWKFHLEQRRIQKKGEGARAIQRTWRGFVVRLKKDREQKRIAAIQIQCVWRGFASKKLLKRMKKANKHASKIMKFVLRLSKRRRFLKQRAHNMEYNHFIVRIQCCMRKYLARKRVSRKLVTDRSAVELENYLSNRLDKLLMSIELKILLDTIHHPLGHKYIGQYNGSNINGNNNNHTKNHTNTHGSHSKPKSHAHSHNDNPNSYCLCYGPFQACYVLAACSKGRTDPSALLTNKADPNAFQRFFNHVREFMEKTDNERKQNNKKRENTHCIVNLIAAFEKDMLLLPHHKTLLSTTDVTLAYNRSKSALSTGNTLVYSDFLECLKRLADIHYNEKIVTKKKQLHTAGSESDESSVALVALPNSADASRPGTVAYDIDNPSKLLQIGNDVSIPEISDHNSDDASVKTSFTANTNYTREGTTKQIAYKKSSSNRKIRKKMTLTDLLADLNLLREPNADYFMVLVLKILSSYRREHWFANVIDWLVKERSARLNSFVVRIQNLVRTRHARHIRNYLLVQKHKLDYLILKNTQIVTCQSVIRMFIYRRQVNRLAQRVIIRYMPHLDDPYYYNPATKVNSWTKPKILAHLDCYSIALPEKGLENIIHCSYCSTNIANINCYQCEDSYCKICFESMHCKGIRKHHNSEKIPNCSYCRKQIATKSCLTCILNKPIAGTIQENLLEIERGNYCDTCFVHEHDKLTKVMNQENHIDQKKMVRSLLNRTKESYLIKQLLTQQIITNHKYDNIIQVCEECNNFTASWRCYDCKQVYCNKCLIGLHSIGGSFSKHKAEVLPYYTTEMHKNFLKDFNEQSIQKKMEKVLRAATKAREEREYYAVLSIQSWWRMICGRYLGKKYMKSVRRRHRKVYRAYKKQTEDDRNTLGYRIQNIFGLAPPLATDTKEESVLKRLNVFQRQTAREFIWKNQDDWGFYRESRTVPRKGIPHRGFDVGTIDELHEQAQYGGYRMPGRVKVVRNEVEFITTHDLTVALRRGEYVRIKKQLFGIINITPTTIRLSRPWRGDSSASGELLYRLSSYKNEPKKNYYYMKYLSFSLTVGNPITQLTLKGLRAMYRRLTRFSLSMMKVSKRNKLIEEEENWKMTAQSYNNKVKFLSGFILTGEMVYDISLDGPLEVDDYKNGQKGSRKLKPKKGIKKPKKKRDYTAVAAGATSGDNEDENEYYDDDDDEYEDNGDGDDDEVDADDNSDGTAKKGPSKGLHRQQSGRVYDPVTGKYETVGERVQITEKKKKANKTSSRPPGVQWHATKEEMDARNERENKMSPEELAAEANHWKECIDIMTENVYYLNIYTNEIFVTTPRAVRAKRTLEFENSRNKKNYDEAQKRIKYLEMVTNNRLLITGGRKR